MCLRNIPKAEHLVHIQTREVLSCTVLFLLNKTVQNAMARISPVNA